VIPIPAFHSWSRAPRYSHEKWVLLRYMKMRREQIEMHLDIYSCAMLSSEVSTVQAPCADIAKSKGAFSTRLDTSFV
jgi:hypothetical protein